VRVILQRVSRAEVRVEGRSVGSVGRGFLALVGFTAGDSDSELAWIADKIAGLRVFPDEEGKMNRDVREIGGSILVVSQFTLYADIRKGRRPSFVNAAPPEEAELRYNEFIEELRRRDLPVESGEFGALMDVELVNDGPVTLILERC
jgi:D-tyrosyl-tRNA(Tyr) deacylase